MGQGLCRKHLCPGVNLKNLLISWLSLVLAIEDYLAIAAIGFLCQPPDGGQEGEES